MRKPITASEAATVGPYSHGIETSGLIYLSGQTSIESSMGKLAVGGIEDQVRQCFRNLEAVLRAAGLSLHDVVKCNVFLTDMTDSPSINAVYAEHFAKPYPARTTIGVASLASSAGLALHRMASGPSRPTHFLRHALRSFWVGSACPGWPSAHTLAAG